MCNNLTTPTSHILSVSSKRFVHHAVHHLTTPSVRQFSRDACAVLPCKPDQETCVLQKQLRPMQAQLTWRPTAPTSQPCSGRTSSAPWTLPSCQ